MNTSKIGVTFKGIASNIVYDEAQRLHKNGTSNRKMQRFYNDVVTAQNIPDYNIDKIVSYNGKDIAVFYGVSDNNLDQKGKFSTLDEAMQYGTMLQKAVSNNTTLNEKKKLFKKLVNMACRFENTKNREKCEDLLNREIFFSAVV